MIIDRQNRTEYFEHTIVIECDKKSLVLKLFAKTNQQFLFWLKTITKVLNSKWAKLAKLCVQFVRLNNTTCVSSLFEVQYPLQEYFMCVTIKIQTGKYVYCGYPFNQKAFSI